MAGRTHDEAPALFHLLIDALVFWLRRQGLFWMLALPIAGLAAGITYVVETNLQFIDYRRHWAWDLLFALAYAMFLDRWIKEALLDGATDCEEVDGLRRSIISWRYPAFAVLLFALAAALAQAPLLPIAVLPWLPELIVWSGTAMVFVLMLPALSAGEPAPLREVWRLGRPVWAILFSLVCGAALLSLLASTAVNTGLQLWAAKSWVPAALAAAARLFDCLLLAFVGNALAALYCRLTGWQQPAPADHTYRNVGIRARKA